MVLNPGESTIVSMRFTMSPGMSGFHDFRLHFVSNDPSAPERTLSVRSNWIP
jgi:DNA-binding MurR/RpiR family transcriptional regulator